MSTAQRKNVLYDCLTEGSSSMACRVVMVAKAGTLRRLPRNA
jgi:hypothetical protein